MSLTGMFKGMANQGQLIVPQLQAGLYEPRWEKFSIDIEAYEERDPDYHFHPSSHPTWPVRWLYWWMVDPGLFPPEKDPRKTLSVTFGSFWHMLIQHVGLHHGIWHPQPICGHDAAKTAGFQNTQAEVCVEDTDTLSRGHADGEHPDEESGIEVKTMNPMTARKIPTNLHVSDPTLLDLWKKMKPGYWYQAQEYMRLRGWGRMITVVCPTSYPFDMIEIHIPRDEAIITEIRVKYEMALEAVERQQEPPLCHAPMTREAESCVVCSAVASM